MTTWEFRKRIVRSHFPVTGPRGMRSRQFRVDASENPTHTRDGSICQCGFGENSRDLLLDRQTSDAQIEDARNIGVQLLSEGDEDEDSVIVHTMLWAAIRTIMVADLVMSLDNVIAVAAAAKDSVTLLILGLAISIPLIMRTKAMKTPATSRPIPIVLRSIACLLFEDGSVR